MFKVKGDGMVSRTKIQECLFGHLDAHNVAAIYQAIRRSQKTQILKFARVSFPGQGGKKTHSQQVSIDSK